jgi:GNAT superfamily N-acetyltransferase
MLIDDLAPDDARIAVMLPVLTELRGALTPQSFDAIYSEGWPQGLRFTAAFDGDKAGARCLGVAGWRIFALTFGGRKLYVDDLVTTSGARSKGVGRALIEHLTGRARAARCTAIDLDSGVQRYGAHRFYLREGFDIVGHHFAKQLRP